MIYGVGVCPAVRHICFCLDYMTLLCGLYTWGTIVEI